MRSQLAGASFVFVLAMGVGCWSASFHASDASFVGAPNLADPAVYLTRLPGEPYRAVGIIEIDGPGTPTVEQVLPHAVEKGKEIGCQVLIWRRLWAESAALGRPIAVVAQQGLGLGSYNHPSGVTIEGGTRGGKHQFICGIWTSAKNPGE
jgi:hypothetical protein